MASLIKTFISSKLGLSSITLFTLLGFCLFFANSQTFQRWENLTWSTRVNAFLENSSPSQDIVLILVDQNSLDRGSKEQMWSWPWPRPIYGHLIDYLQKIEVASITLDLIFSEPSSSPSDDQQFASSIESGSPVFTGIIIDQKGQDGNRSWPCSKFGFIDQNSNTKHSAIFPIDDLQDSFSGFGDVMAHADLDQMISKVRTLQHFDGHLVPLLGLAPYFHLSSLNNTNISQKFAKNTSSSSIPHNIPKIFQKDNIILNFRGPSLSHQHYSCYDILIDVMRDAEGLKPKQNLNLKGKHIFIGYSAPGLKDIRKTPVNGLFAGVEIHATALDNALNNDFITAAPKWMIQLEMLLITIGAIFISHFKKYRYKIFLSLMTLGLPIGISFYSYLYLCWWPMAAPTFLAFFSICLSFFISSLFETRQKKFIRQAFGYYLSKDVIEKVLINPNDLKLGGERKTLTIMFSDLAGFSSISEKMKPIQLTKLLNDYLSHMTDIILEESGTLDKYEGDAIMAFWNAPLDCPNHATKACTAAIRCQRKLLERSPYYKETYGVDMSARIGIHTGEVVVGNMGSNTRFDYTVLGDAANLASRLEGANKAFSSNIMVSEETRSLVQDDILFRTISKITVVGRKRPLWVYEPLAFPHEELEQEWLTWNIISMLIEQQDWNKAIHSLAKFNGNEKEKKIWLKALSQKDWDGIIHLDSK
jgi:adenylate cyclase